MHKPRRFVIKCKLNVNFYTASIWVNKFISILSSIFLFIYLFSLSNKLYNIYIVVYRLVM